MYTLNAVLDKGKSLSLPTLLLLSPQRQQRPIFILPPRNLNNKKPDKVRQNPITAMSTQHIQILNVQRSTAARYEIIDLAIIVQELHTLFCNFLACEIVCFEFNV